ncbi:MAG: DsbA family oxidoreductase [Rhizobiaceae bacterium]|nr:DsbA family oxidoreductase [Rhizobiaceae bacterium]
MADQPHSISIDLVSDMVCPWCYVGQKRVEKAIGALPDIDVTVRWRPYQLDPTIPPAGKDRRAYMLAKFGSEQRIREIHARIEPIGAAEGIDFDFDAIKVAPNTLDAHRVVRWASNAAPGVQNDLVKRLFKLYFEEGADIGDHAILARAAGEAGMDASVIEAMLPADADRDEVVQEIQTASRMGITGVPCFLLEGRYAVVGAQDTATLVDAIRQVAAEKAKASVETDSVA